MSERICPKCGWKARRYMQFTCENCNSSLEKISKKLTEIKEKQHYCRSCWEIFSMDILVKIESLENNFYCEICLKKINDEMTMKLKNNAN